ncbi:hypothetical protein O988_00767 [Pseudogymnoascus sp. VKM F-3808]|nr:hypothetical protein O988_00767 [Pseudogymnoascus sp. VKM F-3808]
MPRFLARLISAPSRRLLSTSSVRPAFATGPSPPRLPPKEQEEFERLQKSSTGAFSTPRATPQINQSPASKPQVNQNPAEEESSKEALAARIEATGKGEELHPDVRRGAKPEFEGEVNPKTGEVGGPKNDPLKWGGEADWSYNGRVTDF